MEYRREVDGLRALAVLPVILFHAGFDIFSGGFSGVDVFFVISGYLITAIILSEIEGGSFSILNFYERRARRIIPALFLVMLICLPPAWIWLLPGDMRDFSKSLMAVSAFSSNLLFWKESGYFEAAAEIKPLLHTWSLAVEEQYYLVFPLFLLAIWRFGRRWVLGILALLGLMSLSLAQWGSTAKPVMTFYLLPTRGWELLIGVFVALHLAGKGRVEPPRLVREVGGFVGLGLLIYAIVAFDDLTPFPSLYALVPTVGTALILLYATSGTMVGRLLGVRLLVGIGLVSYSAYLWHQPLFAFARHRSIVEPSQSLFLLLAALSLVLAYFTWKYVERPFRDRDAFDRRKIFSCCAIGSVIFIGFGLWGYRSGGFPERMSPLAAGLERPVSGYAAGCKEADRTKSPCLLGDAEVKPSIAIFGDSHAFVLGGELSADLYKRHVSAVMYEGSWCPPLIDVGTDNVRKNPACRKFIQGGYSEVLKNPGISRVVLVAEWSSYTTGYRWPERAPSFYTDVYSGSKSIEENRRVVERGLQRTLAALRAAGKSVVIMKPVPEYEVVVPKALARRVLLAGVLDSDAISMDVASYRSRNAEIEKLFDRLHVESGVKLLATSDVLCPQGRCLTHLDSESLYMDSNHLSGAGARLVVPHLVAALGY